MVYLVEEAPYRPSSGTQPIIGTDAHRRTVRWSGQLCKYFQTPEDDMISGSKNKLEFVRGLCTGKYKQYPGESCHAAIQRQGLEAESNDTVGLPVRSYQLPDIAADAAGVAPASPGAHTASNFSLPNEALVTYTTLNTTLNRYALTVSPFGFSISRSSPGPLHPIPLQLRPPI